MRGNMIFSTLSLFVIFVGLLFFLFGLFKLYKLLKSEHEFVENYLYTYSAMVLSVVLISYVLSQIMFSIALLVILFLFAIAYVLSHDRLPFKGPVFNVGYRELLGSGYMGMISFMLMLWGLFFMMSYGIAIYSYVTHSLMTSLVVSGLLAIVIGYSVFIIYGNKYYIDLKQTTEIRKDIGHIIAQNPKPKPVYKKAVITKKKKIQKPRKKVLKKQVQKLKTPKSKTAKPKTKKIAKKQKAQKKKVIKKKPVKKGGRK